MLVSLSFVIVSMIEGICVKKFEEKKALVASVMKNKVNNENSRRKESLCTGKALYVASRFLFPVFYTAFVIFYWMCFVKQEKHA